MISISEAFYNWEADIKPAVVAQYGEDDRLAMSESWNDFTDTLCRDGELTDLQWHYCPSFDEPMPDCDREFILEEMGVSFTALRIAERPDGVDDWGEDASHWQILIKRGKQDMSAFYSMGSAHTGNPDWPSVFYCLLMDSDGIEGSDFESWAADYGFDTDSRKAERMFNACKKTLHNLERIFTYSELESLRDLFHDYN